MRALAFLLWCSTFVIAPFRGAVAQNVAIDTLAARQLSEAWVSSVKDSTAFAHAVGCGYAHYEGENVVIDSVPQLAPAGADATVCRGTGTNAVFGFTLLDEDYADTVLGLMGQVLKGRTDLVVLGQVHGVQPTFTPSGRRIIAPLIWAAWRPAPPRTSQT